MNGGGWGRGRSGRMAVEAGRSGRRWEKAGKVGIVHRLIPKQRKGVRLTHLSPPHPLPSAPSLLPLSSVPHPLAGPWQTRAMLQCTGGAPGGGQDPLPRCEQLHDRRLRGAKRRRREDEEKTERDTERQREKERHSETERQRGRMRYIIRATRRG